MDQSISLTRCARFDAPHHRTTRATGHLALVFVLATVAQACRPSRTETSTLVIVRVDQPAVQRVASPVVALPVAVVGSTPSPVVQLPRALVDNSLHAALAPDIVLNASVARRVLYSWTTPEQVEQLRARPALLTRWTSPTHGASYVDVFLRRLADRGEEVARVLREPVFRRARFGWVSSWPTIRGWEGETYGNKLIRITLRPDAVVVLLWSGSADPQIIDMSGARLDPLQIQQYRTRIAAVFFTHLTNTGSSFESPLMGRDAPAGAYRDYMLVNEKMIEQWEVDTPECIAEVVRSRHVARLLLANVARIGTPIPGYPFGAAHSIAWIRNYPAVVGSPALYDDSTLARQYDTALSILSTRYAPSSANFTALVEALDGVSFGPAIVHRVDPAAVAPPPREIVRDRYVRTVVNPPRRQRCQGTMCP